MRGVAELLPSIDLEQNSSWGMRPSRKPYSEFTADNFYILSSLVHTGGVLVLWCPPPLVPDDTGRQAVGGPAGVRV